MDEGKELRRAATLTALTLIAMTAATQPAAAYHHDSNQSEIRWNNYGEEPFREAQQEGKPVMLLVTAEWCHWCQEFWHNSLQNETVANYVNRNYVPIFLDYDVYRNVGNRYLGQGLPTVVVFAPDGTEIKRVSGHIPPTQFLDGLRQLKTYVEEDYRPTQSGAEERPLTKDDTDALTPQEAGNMTRNFDELLKGRFDPGYGGFGMQPLKPSTPLIYYYTLNRYNETGDTTLLNMTKKTLDHVAKGNYTRGLYDHVDGGFWHYAIQRDWRDPHYEKITWKNAFLSKNYLLLHEATGEDRYREIGTKSLNFLTHSLKHDSGGYYGSMVADPDYYSLPKNERERRGKPAVNGVIYARSTAAATAALAESAEITGNDRYLREARDSGDFLTETLVTDQGALHLHDPATGENEIDGTLRANAWTALGLLELHEATGEEKYLQTALDVIEYSDETLAAEDEGYYEINTTSKQYREEDRFSPTKPAGLNGIMALALVKAHDATGEERYLAEARETLAVFQDKRAILKQQSETAGALMLAAQAVSKETATGAGEGPGMTPPTSGSSTEKIVQGAVLAIFLATVAALLYLRTRED